MAVRIDFGIGIILENPRKGILLQDRDNKPGIWSPGVPSIITGGVEAEDGFIGDLETLISAAKREIIEEIGKEAPKLVMFHEDLIIRKNNYLKRIFFHGRIPYELNELECNEGKGLRYVSRDEIIHEEIPQSIKKVVLRYLSTVSYEKLKEAKDTAV